MVEHPAGTGWRGVYLQALRTFRLPARPSAPVVSISAFGLGPSPPSAPAQRFSFSPPLRHFPSSIRHLPSAIYNPLFAIFYPLSSIRSPLYSGVSATRAEA